MTPPSTTATITSPVFETLLTWLQNERADESLSTRIAMS